VSGPRDIERSEEALVRLVGDELMDGLVSALAAQRLRLILILFFVAVRRLFGVKKHDVECQRVDLTLTVSPLSHPP